MPSAFPAFVRGPLAGLRFGLLAGLAVGCAAARLPDPKLAATRYAEAARAGDSERIFALLKDLVHRERRALLLVTHNPAIADACDRIHTMRDGVIVHSGTPG